MGTKDIGWLELTADLGELAAGSESTINVELSANGLEFGTYYANISFTSNDVTNPLNTVPLRMTVNDVPEFYSTNRAG